MWVEWVDCWKSQFKIYWWFKASIVRVPLNVIPCNLNLRWYYRKIFDGRFLFCIRFFSCPLENVCFINRKYANYFTAVKKNCVYVIWCLYIVPNYRSNQHFNIPHTWNSVTFTTIKYPYATRNLILSPCILYTKYYSQIHIRMYANNKMLSHSIHSS